HMRHPISPLEGEMSGRTEGGAKELSISELASGIEFAPSPSRALPEPPLPRFAGARNPCPSEV
ncbi:hypothetical protein EOD14_13030, partial [Mesorhizobium sp. M7A.T.Ca.US.000.02.1.1]